MSPRRALQQYVQALRARLHREGRAPTDGELAELRARYDAAADTPLMHHWPGEVTQVDIPLPDWSALEMEFGPAPEPEPSESTAKSPAKRYGRPSKPVPVETARLLEALLKQRKAEPRSPALSHPAIAKRCGVSRYVVRRADQLERAGWPLAKSDPDFSPFPPTGSVVWPSNGTRVRQLLTRAP